MKLILILAFLLFLDRSNGAVVIASEKPFQTKVEDYLKIMIQDESVIPLKNEFDTVWAAAMSDSSVSLGSNLECSSDDLSPSTSPPTSVHSLRPADIKVIAAMGDSLTAGTGIGAQSVLDMLTSGSENRGLVFSAGGDGDLSFMTTLPNVLIKLNPSLVGASHGIGPVDDVSVSHLNVAVPGAKAKDLLSQAEELVKRINEDPAIDAENDWKMITIFIGTNDLCQFCVPDPYAGFKNPFFPPPAEPTKSDSDEFGRGIRAALDLLKSNLNRTYVNLLDLEHVEYLRQLDATSPFCQFLHGIECPCLNADNKKYSKYSGASGGPFYKDPFGNPFGFPFGKPSKKPTDNIVDKIKQYQAQIRSIGADVAYDNDDFVTVVQSFLANATIPTVTPIPGFKSRGKAPTLDLSFFAPDCFHFSQKGHALVAKSLWEALLQPADAKSGTLSTLATNLSCPDAACPLLRTSRNTANCSVYLPPPTTPGPPTIVTAGTIIIPGPSTEPPTPGQSSSTAARPSTKSASSASPSNKTTSAAPGMSSTESSGPGNSTTTFKVRTSDSPASDVISSEASGPSSITSDAVTSDDVSTAADLTSDAVTSDTYTSEDSTSVRSPAGASNASADSIPSRGSTVLATSNSSSNSTAFPIFIGLAQEFSENKSGAEAVSSTGGSIAVVIVVSVALALIIVMLVVSVTYRINRRRNAPRVSENTPLLSDAVDAQMDQIF